MKDRPLYFISIEGLKKSKVLAAMYNAARPQGMGYLHYTPTPMTEQDAEEILKTTQKFDYVKGRVLKIEFDGSDELDVRLFDRDNGEGCGQIVIDSLRETSNPSNEIIRTLHRGGTLEAAAYALQMAKTKTTSRKEGEELVMTLGADELGTQLRKKVKDAVASVIDGQEEKQPKT